MRRLGRTLLSMILASALISTIFHVFITYYSYSFPSPSFSFSFSTEKKKNIEILRLDSYLSPKSEPWLTSEELDYPKSEISRSDSSQSPKSEPPSAFWRTDEELVYAKSMILKVPIGVADPDLHRPSRNISKISRLDSSLSPKSEVPLRLRRVDEELVYAKSELLNAPVVVDDPDLYPPLFRNVSVFKRSYELMEKILKVYIYQEGEKPIFHRPARRGIYASEGWFMKLMEENKRFVARNPARAHLFYLPYSSRQMEITLYKPGPHKIRRLALFVKDYIYMISSKYPFWNRSRGSDHFVVSCHDWGPHITREHEELRRNTIRALCNADESREIFFRGKDVSLPETVVRKVKRPLQDLGGKPVSRRTILAFFAGQMHGRVRPILLRYWAEKDPDMKIYGPLPSSVSKIMSYVQHMKSSKYCICPMGYEVNSPRIVEAIYYECVPVIIADHFVLPFDDVLDWSTFSVVVAEENIPQLKNILLEIPLSKYLLLQENVKKVQKHFLWHAKPIKYDLFHMILHSVWLSRLNHFQI